MTYTVSFEALAFNFALPLDLTFLVASSGNVILNELTTTNTPPSYTPESFTFVGSGSGRLIIQEAFGLAFVDYGGAVQSVARLQ